jgi:hypothetical protein
MLHSMRALEDCCRDARRARLAELVGEYEPAIYSQLLFELVSTYVPTRRVELEQTLFGTVYSRHHFFGVYDGSQCQKCGRELHVVLIDAQFLELVEQIVHFLYHLVDRTKDDELRFSIPGDVMRKRAKGILHDILFYRHNVPRYLLDPSTPFDDGIHEMLRLCERCANCIFTR